MTIRDASCPRCGAELRASARFCGACGHDRSVAPGARAARRDVRRATGAVATVFLGVLASLVAASILAPEPLAQTPSLAGEALLYGGFVLVGVAAAALVGQSALRRSVFGPASAPQLALGGSLGIVVLAFNVAWLTLLERLATGESALTIGVPDGFAVLLVTTAVLPSLLEEWLCRGVLWTALEGLAGERGRIVTTAILFALLHGLNGAQLLEVPPRLVLGLVLGWLRARTGSLWPCIAGHFANNLFACLLLV